MSVVRLVLAFIVGWFFSGTFITGSGVFTPKPLNILVMLACVVMFVLSLTKD